MGVADSTSYSLARILGRKPRLKFGRFRIYYERRDTKKEVIKDVFDCSNFQKHCEASELPTDRPPVELCSTELHQIEFCRTEVRQTSFPPQELPGSIPEDLPQYSSASRVEPVEKFSESEDCQHQSPLLLPTNATDLGPIYSLAQQLFTHLNSLRLIMESQQSHYPRRGYQRPQHSLSPVSPVTHGNYALSALMTPSQISPINDPMPLYQALSPPPVYFPAHAYGQMSYPNNQFYTAPPGSYTDPSIAPSTGSAPMLNRELYYDQATQYRPATSMTTVSPPRDQHNDQSFFPQTSNADNMAWEGLGGQSSNRVIWNSTAQSGPLPTSELNAIGSQMEEQSPPPYQSEPYFEHNHPTIAHLQGNNFSMNHIHELDSAPSSKEFPDEYCFCGAKYTGK